MSQSEPKHQAISRTLRLEIAAGKFIDQGKLPSEAKLVLRFGTSRPTIARALRTLEEDQLVERRAGSGTYVKELDTRDPNKSIHEVGLLMPDLEDKEIFQLIWGEIATVARTHHFSVMWGAPAKAKPSLEEMEAHGHKICQEFIERRVSGVFFAPSHKLHEINQQFAETLRKAGIPVVLLDKDLVAFPAHGDFDVASIDNIAGGHLLTEHMWKLGCRKFFFVTQSKPAATICARIFGVRESLIQHGQSIDPGLARFGNVADSVFVKQLLTDKPDVLLCSNDETAANLLRTLARLRVSVPQEVRVTGFDDVKLAQLVNPPLTTVQQPSRKIAQIAFGAMLERQNNALLPPRHLMIAPRLVIRESCGTYPSA